MEGPCSGEVQNEERKMKLLAVECEICDRPGHAISNHAGVYICGACHRDIVSPYCIHD